MFVLLFFLTELLFANDFKKFDQLVFQVVLKREQKSSQLGSGTGFVVNTQGLIATNFHVISEMFKEAKESHKYKIFVKIDKQEFLAEIIDVDMLNDLALIKIPHLFENQITFSEYPLLKGDKIYSLGFHDNEYMAITQGTFNDYLKDTENKLLAVSAAINPGMSGGPILNENLEVVGMNCLKNSAKEATAYGVNINHLVSLINKQVLNKKLSVLEVINYQLHETYQKIIQAIHRPLQTQPFGNWEVVDLEHILQCYEYQREKNFDQDKEDQNQNQILVTSKVCSLDPRKVPLSSIQSLINIDFKISQLKASKNTNKLNFFHYINKGFEFEGALNRILATNNNQCQKRNFINKHGVHLRVSICAQKFIEIPSFFKSADYFEFEVKASSLSKEMNTIMLLMSFSSNSTLASEIIMNILDNIKKGQT